MVPSNKVIFPITKLNFAVSELFLVLLDFFSPFVYSQNDKWTIKRKTGKGGRKTEKRGKRGGDSFAETSASGMRKKVREVRNVIIMEIVALPLLLPEPKMRDR